MKKLLILFAAAILCIGTASARDRISHNVNDLPAAARTILKKNFKSDIHHIKVDKELLKSTEYDVVLNDGTEIEFDSEGNWKSIDCGNKAVPDAFILKDIKNYVSKNYSGKKIVDIDKKSSKYEIELSNGVELEFDRAGKFLRQD